MSTPATGPSGERDVATERVGDAVEAVVERVGEAAQAVTGQVGGAAQAVTETVGDAVGSATDAADGVARAAEAMPVVHHGARAGFALDGVLHLAIGWAALKIAWGGRGSADESGAMTSIAISLGGLAVLWVGVVGFGVLALWHLARAVSGRRTRGRMQRWEYAADGVGYGTVAWSAMAFAIGAGVSSRQSTVELTSSVLHLPFGGLLVGLLALVVMAVGAMSAVTGVRRTFLEDLRSDPGRPVVVVGVVGYVARGVAFALAGLLFLLAAWTGRSSEASGLDGAMRFVAHAPQGRVALTAIALGLGCFGLYLIGRARHTA